jgi:uncharacterized repeat protein (TIGR03803 family)
MKNTAQFLQKFPRSVRRITQALLVLSLAMCAQAQTFTSLYSFCADKTNCTEGSGPAAPLVQGTDGNLYGETTFGGDNGSCGSIGCGTIFKITPQGNVTTVYSFCSSLPCTDGSGPDGGLVLASDGNFYGVTSGGGVHNFGTVFRITPAGKLTTLHSFDYTDGWEALGRGLTQAANGSFYGTTLFGGAYGQGVAFEITASGTFTTLHSFYGTPGCPGCVAPNGLTLGADGNLYGTTYAGGQTSDCSAGETSGTFFQLTPAGALTTLHVFCAPTGYRPNSTLLPAPNGNFYGTSAAGGNGNLVGDGTVYEITPTGSITSLYSFCLQTGCPDGKTPIGLAMGTDGNFYGTTLLADADHKGTIYEITPAGQLTTLYSFTATNGNYLDGSSPIGPMLLHTSGTFYGLTDFGGKTGSGTIFSLATGLRPFVGTLPTSGAPGTNVIILGTNLQGATAVGFNGTAARFKVVSASEITTSVPGGATSGTVTVTTSGGKKLNSRVTFQVP